MLIIIFKIFENVFMSDKSCPLIPTVIEMPLPILGTREKNRERSSKVVEVYTTSLTEIYSNLLK